MATPKKKTEISARPQQSERRTSAKPAAAQPEAAASGLQPTNEAVSQRAFQLWEEGGCQPGNELENWLRAERELLGPKQRS
jgi:hypothetical protein